MPSAIEQFKQFIEKDMCMSHIYQPLLIRMLLESGGASTLRDLALRFVTFNEAELQAMEQTLKKMPVQVLKNRGWVEREGDTVRLTVKPNDLKEGSMLIGACERRLHEFIESRGAKIWDYRWLDDPVSGSLRFEILAASGQKCDCWDNAVAESFFKALKSEAIFGISLLELNFAQRVLFEWIEITYNRCRRHSALNHLTIPEFKESFLTSNLAA